MHVLMLLTMISALALAQTAAAAPKLQLEWDALSGAWTGLLVDGRNLISRRSADLSVDSSLGGLPSIERWKLTSRRSKGEVTTLTRRAGDWELVTVFTVRRQEIARSLSVRWLGKEEVTLWGVSLRVPSVRLSDSPGDWYLLPGNYPVSRRSFERLAPGEVVREQGWTRAEYGSAVVHSPSADLSLIAGYRLEADHAGLLVEEDSGCVSLIHRFDTPIRLQPGQKIDTGTQFLRLVRGDEKQMLSALADFSDNLGNGPPADRPAHLDKCVIYEAHPWGRLESWYAGDRGNRYPRLTGLLPYYKQLGVTALWVLPVSWPPPWVYTLPAFDRIAPENGTADELKALVAGAHKLGMKALIDLVVYGIKPDSEEVQRHPDDVWCHDESGKRQIVWGGTVLAADCSHPVWQKRISEVVDHWVRGFGFDGARLDCIGWGQALNWNNPGGAGRSIAYGGLQLNKVVRDSFRAVNPDAFTLPEGGTPLVFRNSDLIFDYPLYLAMRDITTTPDLSLWIRQVREWLEFERLCFPRRALPGLVRWVQNHDVVSPEQYFGVGPSQALMAICALIQGTPLVYQEQETGFSRELARWLKLRNSQRCFSEGDADYVSASCSDPNVFCFLRTSGDGTAVVAVNMTGASTKCKVTWPRELSVRFPLCVDGFSGARVTGRPGSAVVRVRGYRPAVVLLKPAAWSPGPGDRFDKPHVPTASPSASTAWEELPAGGIRIRGARSWFVDTLEGRLEDDFRDYDAKVRPKETPVDVLPVLRRAWNPLAGGLMDGSRRASMGVALRDGRVVVLEIDTTKATDVRIVDGACTGDCVDLVAEPRSCFTVKEAVAVSSPGDIPGVDVGPLFARLRSGEHTLTLARRHGGLPVEMKGLLAGIGELYTDWGIYPNGQYASADGDTNPRLSIDSSGGAPEVSFRGKLHLRAWNGVQTCHVPAPGVVYRLSYELHESRLVITVGVTPSVDLPKTSAFLALRLPLSGVASWRRGQASGKAGESGSARSGESKGTSEQTLLITCGNRQFSVSGAGFQNVFLAGNQLFLALLDGIELDLKAGEEASATAQLDLR